MKLSLLGMKESFLWNRRSGDIQIVPFQLSHSLVDKNQLLKMQDKSLFWPDEFIIRIKEKKFVRYSYKRA